MWILQKFYKIILQKHLWWLLLQRPNIFWNPAGTVAENSIAICIMQYDYAYWKEKLLSYVIFTKFWNTKSLIDQIDSEIAIWKPNLNITFQLM